MKFLVIPKTSFVVPRTSCVVPRTFVPRASLGPPGGPCRAPGEAQTVPYGAPPEAPGWPTELRAPPWPPRSLGTTEVLGFLGFPRISDYSVRISYDFY